MFLLYEAQAFLKKWLGSSEKSIFEKHMYQRTLLLTE